MRSEAREGDEEVQIVVNRQRAAALGLTSADVAQAVAAGMRGDRLREFRGTERELTLRLAFRDSDRQTIDNLAEFPIYLPNGTRVPLSAVADFRIARGPRSIERVDRLTSVAVTGNVKPDATLDGVGKEVEALMKNYQLPAGYTWKLGKGFEQQDENSQTMLFNLLLAIAMIYLVMAAVFESTVYPNLHHHLDFHGHRRRRLAVVRDAHHRDPHGVHRRADPDRRGREHRHRAGRAHQ